MRLPVLLVSACLPTLVMLACGDKDGDDGKDGDILDGGSGTDGGAADGGTTDGGTSDGGSADSDGDGFTVDDGDCDDNDATINPGADEVCDDVDNDCDDEVDEADASDAITWYGDTDEDGYGDEADVLTSCDQPDGYSELSGDCNDDDDAIHPAAEEVCDEVDNDCDGTVDQGASDASTWYYDGDGDDWGVDTKTVESCEPPKGYAEYSGDCDDADTAYNPGADEDDCTDPNDYNCDGSVGYADSDGDGFAACEECDDTDSAIHPDAEEICDDVDNDCDSLIDDDDDSLDRETGSAFYMDGDEDGFGNADRVTLACDAPDGYVDNDADCNDDDDEIHPDADEVCDGEDNDCDDLVDDRDDDLDTTSGETYYGDDDGDGFGEDDDTVESCLAPEGYVDAGGDCDDDDDAIHPDADEICDEGIDNDCNGDADDDDDGVIGQTLWYIDYDRDDFGADAFSELSCEQPDGYVDNDLDCDDTDDAINPAAEEICDGGIDNDCDELADDDDDPVSGTSTFYADVDGDGFGDEDSSVEACEAPDDFVDDASDCDDDNDEIHPDAAEICDDGIDNDCNELADDDDDGVTGQPTWYLDYDSDDYGDEDESMAACEQPDGYVEDDTDCDDSRDDVYPDADEYCDEVDNDCDDDIDEDAVDGDYYATDADGDGFGEPDSTEWSCAGVDNEWDCDDDDDSEPVITSADEGSAAGDGSAESPYDTIQAAVDAASQCVFVEAGTYYEAVDFAGADIEVRGEDVDSTYIDATGTGEPAVKFVTGEGGDAVLTGFTIAGGEGFFEESESSYECTSVTTCTDYYYVYTGGGIYIDGADPSIENVVVSGLALPVASTVESGDDTYYTYSYGGAVAVIGGGAPSISSSELAENSADQGGGIYVDESSSLTVEHTWIVGNIATDGGGIQADMGTVTLTNVVAMWNEASGDGGGLLVDNGTATLVNTTWAGEAGTAGLYWLGSSSGSLWNSVVYDSLNYDIAIDGSASVSAGYSNVYGGALGSWTGSDLSGETGMISSDPMFTAWSDDGDWTNDDPSLDTGSPSVDAGDPDSAYDDADGTTNDQGAWGGPDGDW